MEPLEERIAMSTLPLHVSGTQLLNSANQPVVLRGVNVAGFEWRPDGNNAMLAVDTAVVGWHANLIRLPVNEDFWFGNDQSWDPNMVDPGGAQYRAQIDSVIAEAAKNNAYVVLDLHWSNMDTNPLNDGQHDMPDQLSTQFWQDAAARYANNPAVLFDPYNEPHFDVPQAAGDWQTWRDGGTVTEPTDGGGTVTYQSPGMQGLINTIRATGAHNVIVPEGLNWGSDLSGVANGFALSDPDGNLMYQMHIYPSSATTDAQRDQMVAPVVGKTPIYIGEWGGSHNAGGAGDAADPLAWNQSMVAWLDSHGYSWTAWNMWAATDTDPNNPSFALITDWNSLTPTADFGAVVKAALTPQATNAAPTVASPATASVGTVTGKTVNLKVLGADDAGEANLTYTWTATGRLPAAVKFSVNGTNAAKTTTVTFAKPGVYTFQVTIKDSGGLSTTSTVSVTVKPTFTSLAITPKLTSLAFGVQQQFKATSLDQFGSPLAVQRLVVWSLVGGGSINRTGLYKAPLKAAAATVTASSGGVRASLPITIGPRHQSVKVSFADTDDWGTGFTGYITITNTGNVAVNGWTMAFNFGGNIASNTNKDIWDAVLASHVGTHYVIKNAAWDAVIGVGQSVKFGFNASMKKPHTGPLTYVLTVG
jgi:hypothetical protein